MQRRLGLTSFSSITNLGVRVRLVNLRPYLSLSPEAQEQALKDTAFADVRLSIL